MAWLIKSLEIGTTSLTRDDGYHLLGECAEYEEGEFDVLSEDGDEEEGAEAVEGVGIENLPIEEGAPRDDGESDEATPPLPPPKRVVAKKASKSVKATSEGTKKKDDPEKEEKKEKEKNAGKRASKGGSSKKKKVSPIKMKKSSPPFTFTCVSGTLNAFLF